MKITILVASLALWFGLNNFAGENENALVANSPEAGLVGQIKKEIHDLSAPKRNQNLFITDSSGTISPLMCTPGKASALIGFINDKSKPYYVFQPDFALKDEAATTNAFAHAGIKIPSTWTVDSFDPETFIQYTLPARPEDEQKLVEFIHLLFTKIRKVPESDKLKFQKSWG